MIKKIISVLLVLVLVGLAVFKIFFDSSSFRGELKKVKDELSSYYMEANMELINGEDIRQFFVEVGYRREDNKDLFRVYGWYDTYNAIQNVIKPQTQES